MTQHFTRNTVSAAFYCGKCEKPTQHRIDSGRKGPCLDCIARAEAEYFERLAEKRLAPRQKELFCV